MSWVYLSWTIASTVDVALESLLDRFMTKCDKLHHSKLCTCSTCTSVFTTILICGMVVFCTYGRSRWADAQHGERLIADRDESNRLIYIEVETAMRQTARAMHMKFVFLPLVAPSIGIDNTNWGEAWVSARSELGIDSFKEYPLMHWLMPAPDASHQRNDQADQHGRAAAHGRFF